MLLLKKIIYTIIFRLNKSEKIKLELYEINKEFFKRRSVFIGDNSLVYDCKFSRSSKGDTFHIGNNTTCTGVTFLGHDASPSLFIDELTTDKHPILPFSRQSYRKPIKIGNNVFIGVGCIVLPGIEIADRCVIAAGSVVTKSISQSGVYAGNPAKKISTIESFTDKYRKLLDTEPESF
ncbi:hypothetical protein GCM10007916_00970 [Psychromonas marina]|uniref:Acyltransferase n=1 Tax=Psychromonas marina TaxID=88364 RepID=A0ABQ6DVN8_9GAMM|nr:acyltransferase [Psychromonas marina]GLS89030.1 hypothetical protein GCM10007916_00970 [Psychromonas marina]